VLGVVRWACTKYKSEGEKWHAGVIDGKKGEQENDQFLLLKEAKEKTSGIKTR
jgi:hypothetical protein